MAGLLRRFFLGSGGGRKALYALSAKGAQLAEVQMRGPRRAHDAMLVADFFVQHQLTVNDLYCTLKYKTVPVPQVKFHRWIAFHQRVIPQVNLIPDGYVQLTTSSGITACFIESISAMNRSRSGERRPGTISSWPSLVSTANSSDRNASVCSCS